MQTPFRKATAPAETAQDLRTALAAFVSEPIDEEREAAELFARAAELRAGIVAARAEAETLVSTARAQAAKIVAEAEAQARELTGTAHATEMEAVKAHTRASGFAHAHVLRGTIAEAERQAAELTAEAEALTAKADAITARLDGLGEQREDTGAQLAEAREAGDVGQVAELRRRLEAVDEVVSALTAQREVPLARRRAITADASGELAQVRQRAEAAATELRKVLNNLDPERPEARQDWMMRAIEVQAAEAAAKQAQPSGPQTEQIVLPAIPGVRGPVIAQRHKSG